MELLSSSIQELKKFHEVMLRDHKESLSCLTSILEEVRFLREIIQASGVLALRLIFG